MAAVGEAECAVLAVSVVRCAWPTTVRKCAGHAAARSQRPHVVCEACSCIRLAQAVGQHHGDELALTWHASCLMTCGSLHLPSRSCALTHQWRACRVDTVDPHRAPTLQWRSQVPTCSAHVTFMDGGVSADQRARVSACHIGAVAEDTHTRCRHATCAGAAVAGGLTEVARSHPLPAALSKVCLQAMHTSAIRLPPSPEPARRAPPA